MIKKDGELGKKIEYVMIANRIIEEEGIEALSIRRVAKTAGCTSAVLYRHFENKDHLILVASVKYLRPYIEELMKQSVRKDINSIQMDLLLWRFFINEAFNNKAFYELMFFGSQKDMISECILEYYQMFPEQQKKFDGVTASIIFSSNISEREGIRLRRAANEGLITIENANLLSQLSTAVFTGMFHQYYGLKMDKGSLLMAADNCYQLIYELFKRFVNSGTELDV